MAVQTGRHHLRLDAGNSSADALRLRPGEPRAWVGFVECETELDDQAAYLYDQFVSSKHRGVSIAAALESPTDR